MNTSTLPRALALAVGFGFLLLPICGAQTITQTITLQPGWNAVYVEVQPSNNTANAVFEGLPITSVWTRAQGLSSVDYIQNASEGNFNNSAWLRWFHPSRSEAFLNNLFAVFANRAYLIKSTNATPVVWNITGRPSLKHPAWIPDSFNLRGLPVDSNSPPSFVNFFRYSKAHYDTANGLQKIYRLNASGQWQLVAPADSIQSGVAYWIYSQGASDYIAPLRPSVELGDSLEFGDSTTELSLRFKNLTPSTASILLRELNTPASALSHYQFSATLGGQWVPLSNQLAVAIGGGLDTRLRLGARRQNFVGNSYASVLEIRDGAGTRLLVAVSAEKFTDAAGAAPLAGLWVGTATINAVSEAHSANPTNPTPTKAELNLRLMLHVDSSGQTRLLKEVIQMWRNGTFTNDSSGNRIVDRPGEYVLLTDDTLIPMFGGAMLRDGESVGRRISTIGYDFPSVSSNNFLNLTGSFAIGQSLTGTLTLPHDHPTNPFKHRYHPDHDNLNASFSAPQVESFATSRAIQMEFAAAPPAGPPVPDFGYNEMGGVYRERIAGIHKNAIHLRGTFRLSRVSQIPELNPSPTP